MSINDLIIMICDIVAANNVSIIIAFTAVLFVIACELRK